MSDQFTEVTTQSWGSRLMGSIKSVLVGLLLFVVSFIILWTNEGRAVRTSRGLTEGEAQVIDISADSIKQTGENKLVHLTDKIITEENLTDPSFKINVNALKLDRTVEMYQWVEEQETETRKKTGGSTETTTTYTYVKQWETSLIDWQNFKRQEEHQNPEKFPISSFTNSVSKATIGNFVVSSSLLNKMNSFETYSLDSIDISEHKNAKIIDEKTKIFIGEGTDDNAQIGDIKISFSTIKSNKDYSIIAQQVGNSFEAFPTTTGTEIEIISKGVLSATLMFKNAQDSNTTLTWILRVLGFILMFSGLMMIFKPLSVLGDVLPFIGNLLELGLGVFCGLISIILSLFTVGLAWFFYRPFLGVALLAVSIGLTVFLIKKRKEKKELLDNVRK